MLLGQVRHFLQETTIHGVRYLAGGKSLLEKALWSCLISLSLVACASLILFSSREVAENPFLTSVDAVPIQDLSFPAVSIAGVEDGRHLNPWRNFQRLVLDSLVFDCAHQEGDDDSNCTSRRLQAREAFSVLVGEVVGEALNNVERESLGASNETIQLVKYWVCALAAELFGYDSQQHMAAIARILEDGSDEQFVDFQELGKLIFRKSQQEALLDIHTFVEKHHNYTSSLSSSSSSSSCIATYKSNLKREIVVKIFAWLVSQGAAHYPILLGQLLDISMSDASKLNGNPKYERVVSTLYKLCEHLFPSDVLRLTKPNDYLLGRMGYNSLINLVHGWRDAEECYVYYNVARTSLDRGQKEFCQLDKECCKVEREITARYSDVLKLMKFSLQPHTWSREEDSDVGAISRGAKSLGFPARPSPSFVCTTEPVIYSSVLHGFEETDSHPVFKRSFGNKGIAYTFNGDHFWKIFKKTSSMEAFHKEVHMVKETEEVENHKTLYPKANGPLFSLELLVDAPQSGRLITIHHPLDLPDFINEPIEVYPGNAYNILVTPSVMTVEDGVKKLSPLRKNCISHDSDRELTMFRKYTKSRCMHECRLKRAADSCGCIPWDYPRFDQEVPICHFWARECFKTELSKGVAPTECSCMNDCHGVSYTHDVLVKDAQSDDYCFSFWRKHVSPWQDRNDFFDTAASFSFEQLRYFTLEPHQACKEALQSGIAAVKIYIGPPAAHVSTRSLRVTFTDRIANIGGRTSIKDEQCSRSSWPKNRNRAE